MSKIHNRMLIAGFTVLLFQGMTGAVSSEYKNSLEKVELLKTGDDNYSVNLYMQKNYLSPVKVIKKSDLSYYILLPETKNSSSSINFKTPEIQNVSTSLHPYAGVDVNNGYTKININTTKPIEFNLNIKSSSYMKTSAPTPVIAQKSAEIPIVKKGEEEAKIQKKNSTVSKEKVKTEEPKKNLVKEKNSVDTSADNQIRLAKKKPVQTTKILTETKQNNTLKNTSENNLITAKKAESKNADKNVNHGEIKQKKEVKDVLIPDREEEFLKGSKEESHVKETPDANKETFYDAAEIIANAQNEQNQENQENIEEEPLEENIAAAAKLTFDVPYKNKIKTVINLIEDKLGNWGLSLFDAMLIFFTGLSGFLVMLFLMSNRQNSTKIKRKADLLEINEKPSFVPKKDIKQSKNVNKNNNDGKYFVFDKNVRQTGFLDPATSAIKKNYELSTYDPEINSNYGHIANAPTEQNESEYDIIQRILKEDTFVEIDKKQAETLTKEKIEHNYIKEEKEEEKEEVKEEIQKKNAFTSPIPKETQPKQQEIEIQDGLIMLSKAEIAPEIGFMCVSYEKNISLVGYIYEDIFVLHNFKKPQLENYDIKFRLSEKDDKNSLYIVKVDEEKMIVSVNNKAMNLEINL